MCIIDGKTAYEYIMAEASRTIDRCMEKHYSTREIEIRVKENIYTNVKLLGKLGLITQQEEYRLVETIVPKYVM